MDSLCAATHEYDICKATHVSWYVLALHPTAAPYGLGFNPPTLVDICYAPSTNMLFLHEYGDTNSSYNWNAADGCDLDTKSFYMCIAEPDPDYSNKFKAPSSKNSVTPHGFHADWRSLMLCHIHRIRTQKSRVREFSENTIILPEQQGHFRRSKLGLGNDCLPNSCYSAGIGS
ncbi:hypothetical protein B0O99DRAFT_624344 [Bisporella sp. PMI_857]|nr:hypothetical protein B0O99DRAFT_624344 [Bisporella sp. PMI_857]